jgi:hypothetical protein
MLPPLPRCTSWAYSSLISPRRISLPRKGCRVGLHIVLFAETSDRGENIDDAKADRLREQSDRLRDQIRLEREKSHAEEQRLQSQIAGAATEITALTQQQTIQRERVEIARQQLVGAVELANKGYLSQVEMRRRQDAHLAEIQSESSLAKELAGKQTEISQQQNALQQLPIATAQRVAQLEGSIAELNVRLNEIEGRRGYLLSAPIAGRVFCASGLGRQARRAEDAGSVDRARRRHSGGRAAGACTSNRLRQLGSDRSYQLRHISVTAI